MAWKEEYGQEIAKRLQPEEEYEDLIEYEEIYLSEK